MKPKTKTSILHVVLILIVSIVIVVLVQYQSVWEASSNKSSQAVLSIITVPSNPPAMLPSTGDWDILLELLAPPTSYIIGMAGTAQDLHVYLSDTIGSPDKYADLAAPLALAKEGETIHIHLSGFGGNASTIFYFNNIIAASKATVIMEVDGDVMSAHAAIAMMGNKTHVGQLTVFLFHYPAILGPNGEYVAPSTICPSLKGKDRGIPNSVNCMEEVRQFNHNMQIFFNAKIAPYLTKDEIRKYYAGYQVMITGDDMTKRMAGHNA